MRRLLDRFSRLVTVRPYITILVLLLITVGLAAGAAQRAEPIESASLEFLPPDSDYLAAVNELEEFFGEAGDVSVVTLVFRGEAFTPAGLTQIDALVDDIVAEPEVVELLAHPDAVIAPSTLFEAAGVSDFTSISQAEIDAVVSAPELAGAFAAMSGNDADGTSVAVSTVRVRDTGDERVVKAERTINDLASASQGPLRAGSVSLVVIEDEYKEATESGMAPLIGLTLLLIAALILLFMRTLSDLLLTLTGLIFSVTWIVGAEGWLGPNALGWIGPPSALSAMVPIIMISLTVDYAIQAVSHYREQRVEGESVLQAVRIGLRNVAVPLLLAAVTTIAGFLANLFSPIGVVGDFGIVSGLGVGLSLIVMLTLVPAGRTIVDRRREARGKLAPPRLVSSALPGIESAAEKLGTAVARRPAVYLVAVLGVTIWLGFAATGLNSEFTIRDILPRDGDVLKDLETLEASVGGSTELASVLVRAEATETRTLLNVRDLEAAFADERRRPSAAAGPMAESYGSLLRDWAHDSGVPGDKFDSELAGLFTKASSGVRLDSALMEQIFAELEARDPGFATVLVNNPEGVDSILLQFPTYTDDPGSAVLVQEDIERLWDGDDDGITVISQSVLGVTITDLITSGQTEAISSTVAVALSITALFFWVTLRRPVLGVVAVGPIVLVLIWVLGTMALLGIPYSLITSMITALSIGIGVDYTIHMIHRYQEEFARVRNPEKAAIRTLATTGSALLGSALTTALGFSLLIFSPLEGFQQFGITSAITIGYSLLVSILVVPPAMTVWGAYENMRLRSSMQSLWDDLDVAIEDVHSRHDEKRADEKGADGC
ncbi:MAG: MMPL family transporter [Acidimicrobiaceae bacterium]|nr:MMPL family transporter [Acidimicrobiaceae bacterium]